VPGIFRIWLSREEHPASCCWVTFSQPTSFDGSLQSKYMSALGILKGLVEAKMPSKNTYSLVIFPTICPHLEMKTARCLLGHSRTTLPLRDSMSQRTPACN
jgi:hypothetical protein